MIINTVTYKKGAVIQEGTDAPATGFVGTPEEGDMYIKKLGWV